MMVVNFLYNAGDRGTDPEIDSQNKDVSVVDSREAFKDFRMCLHIPEFQSCSNIITDISCSTFNIIFWT